MTHALTVSVSVALGVAHNAFPVARAAGLTPDKSHRCSCALSGCRVQRCPAPLFSLPCAVYSGLMALMGPRCQVAGCNRLCKSHRQECCGGCILGVHSRRCDRRFAFTQRQGVSPCNSSICGRMAGSGHLHCCAYCAMSEGRQHKKSCGARQMQFSLTGQTGAGQPGASDTTTAARVRGQQKLNLNEMD